MAVIQPIIDLVELLAQHNVTQAILCPGSRSAALTLSFARNNKFTCYSISDERSAAFIAMGMAQAQNKPVVVVCTSGSAVYNLAPAVAEAFFQQIPLIVITADRPLEWIHQNDGQTIYQQDIFGKHVKKSYQLPADFQHEDSRWFVTRVINESVHIAQFMAPGPVHINIPIREPFYPLIGEAWQPSPINKIDFIYSQPTLRFEDIELLKKELSNFNSVVILVGQQGGSESLNNLLQSISTIHKVPVIADQISNVKSDVIRLHDLFLGQQDDSLCPDLLITFGESNISKSIKIYFRKHKTKAHWHIQNYDIVKDPLQSLTKIIQADPIDILSQLFDNQSYSFNDVLYESWHNAENKAKTKLDLYFKQYEINAELWFYNTIFSSVPKASDIHVANSMAVRYLNMLGTSFENINIWANRGTSGIDGCLSTAVGHAQINKNLQISIIGDVAFQYDKNALWNIYVPENLRIVIMNNRGGGIFRLIDGPSQQAELNDYFVTEQNTSAENICKDANLDYFKIETIVDLVKVLPIFWQKTGKAKCIEVFTDGELNTSTFKNFKTFFVNS